MKTWIYSLAIGMIAATLAITALMSGGLQPVENAFFDARLRRRSAGAWPREIVTVVIDNRAQAAHGLWRWDRAKQAGLYQRVKDLGAKTPGGGR